MGTERHVTIRFEVSGADHIVDNAERSETIRETKTLQTDKCAWVMCSVCGIHCVRHLMIYTF